MSSSEPTGAFGARFLHTLRERAGGTPFDYATAKRIKGLERAALMEQLRKLAVADFGTLKRLAALEDPEELARELARSWRRMQANWAHWNPADSAPPTKAAKRERPPKAKAKASPNVDTFGAKFVRALRKEWGGTPFDYALTQKLKPLEHAGFGEALVENECVDRASLAVARSCNDPAALAVKVAEAWRARRNEGIQAGPVRLAPDAWSTGAPEAEQPHADAPVEGPFGTRFLNALRHHWSEAKFDYATTKRIKAMSRAEVLAALRASGKLDRQTLDATEYFESPEQLARLVATAWKAARANSLGAVALEAWLASVGVF
jgi:hypothetical protein